MTDLRLECEGTSTWAYYESMFTLAGVKVLGHWQILNSYRNTVEVLLPSLGGLLKLSTVL